MAHLNIYLPDELAGALKQEAQAAGVPLSRYISSRLPGGRQGDDWPPGFFERSCGFLTEDMEEPTDAPPEPIEAADIA